MNTLLPDNLSELDTTLKIRLEKCKAGILCPETLKEEARSLRTELGWTQDCGLLISAGHQPVIYHPGLLMKDVLAHFLAKRYNGVAYNIVLDTDEVDPNFSYPGLMDLDYSSTIAATASWPVQKRTARFGNPGRIVGTLELTETDRNKLLNACEDARKKLHLVLNPSMREEVRARLIEYQTSLKSATSILEPSMILRRMAHEELGISIRDVRASTMFRTSAFYYFASFVAERAHGFRKIYNQELRYYRESRRIKNPAQPLPDLDEAAGELPFWLVQDGVRQPLTDEDFAQALEWARAGRADIYPRAVTTSLFFRLFFCDLFIHGTGGGRYDRITEALIEHFFECDAAPFIVTTASLEMEPRADLPVESRSIEEVQRELRQLHFDPAGFVSADCALSRQREDLIQRWHESRKSGKSRAQLHLQFRSLRRKAGLYLRGKRSELQQELARARHVMRARKIYADRSYPALFYNLKPLMQAASHLASQDSSDVSKSSEAGLGQTRRPGK